jgi:hypothetical protein
MSEDFFPPPGAPAPRMVRETERSGALALAEPDEDKEELSV